MSLQACRAYAVLGVVLSHIAGLEERYFHSAHARLLHLGNIGVDIFFVISGIVISSVTIGKFGEPRQAVRFLYKRFARIYPVFWVYFAIAVLIYELRPAMLNAMVGHTSQLWLNMFLIPSHSLNLISQAWTLSHEIAFYLVFGLLMLVLKEKWLERFLVLWVVAIAANGLATVHPPIYLAIFVSGFNLEFVAGCFIFIAYRRYGARIRLGRPLIAAGVIWLAVLTVWCIVTHSGNTEWIGARTWTRLVFWGPPAALIVWGALESEGQTRVFGAAWLYAIGDWSYSIYLSHLMLVAAIGRPLAALLRNVPGGFLIAYVFIVPCTIGFGFLSYHFLEQPLQRRFKRAAAPQPVMASSLHQVSATAQYFPPGGSVQNSPAHNLSPAHMVLAPQSLPVKSLVDPKIAPTYNK
jgi:exopolysaccharide production protein ExoZ